jgi:hypothetical protein
MAEVGRSRRVSYTAGEGGGGDDYHLEGQKEHTVIEVFGVPHHRDKFEVVNTFSDRDAELVRVDHAPKGNPLDLTARRLSKQIIVLREQYSAALQRAIEQFCVSACTCAVLGCGQDIYIARTQRHRDCAENMLIHVEGDGHSDEALCAQAITEWEG